MDKLNAPAKHGISPVIRRSVEFMVGPETERLPIARMPEAMVDHLPDLWSAGRALPAGVVDGVFTVENDFGDGDKGIALLQQGLNNSGQGLRRVNGGVVEQNDGAGLYFPGDPTDDIVRRDLFPVQTVTARNSFNLLHCNGFPVSETTTKRRRGISV